MKTITIALDENAEKILRLLALDKYQGKKGAISKVVSEALQLLFSKTEKSASMERQFKWMDKGFEMGKINYKSRSELYERR